MEFICSCEKFDSHKDSSNDFIIADESNIILSPAYLYTFEDRLSNVKYSVISDNVGYPMPHLELNNKIIIGTSRYIYFYDISSKKTKSESLNSPCMELIKLYNKILVISECDIMIISLEDNSIKKFEFNDIIVDYKICQNCLYIFLLEGGKKKVNILS